MTMIRRFRAGLLFKGKGKASNAVAHNFRFHSPTIRANEKGLGNPKIFPVFGYFSYMNLHENNCSDREVRKVSVSAMLYRNIID
jgi:hypothetical protein